MGNGNDYVIQVKGNQMKLKEAISSFTQQNEPVDRYETREKVRGRNEIRQYYTYQGMSAEPFTLWTGLTTIIIVKRSAKRKGRTSSESSMYISSRTESKASFYARGIRAHWFIENKLHWVKDKIWNEDNSLVNGFSLARNMSMVRTFVFNIFKLNNEQSMTVAQEKYANRLSMCINAINIKNLNKLNF